MLTETEIIGKIREAVGDSQERFAEKLGVTPPFVSQVLAGKKRPSAKMLDVIGYRKVKLYAPK